MIPFIPEMTIDNPSEFLENLAESVARVTEGDYTPVFRKVMVDLEEYHDFYFQEEISFEGQKWQELAPLTIEAKGHDTILVDTGRLKASLIGDTGDSIREIVGEANTPGFRFGTSVEYAIYHQVGTKQYGGNLPARPMVGVPEAAVEKIFEDVQDHIMGLFFVGPPDSRY